MIPKGFGDAAVPALFGGGQKPELTLLRDPNRMAEAGMVRGMLTQHVMQAVSTEAFSPNGLSQAPQANRLRSTMPPPERTALVAPASGRDGFGRPRCPTPPAP